MALQEGQSPALIQRLDDCLLEFGEEVDEDVGHRDAPKDREPCATGGGVEEARNPLENRCTMTKPSTASSETTVTTDIVPLGIPC